MTAPKTKPDDPAQSQRFIDMARELEASEDPAVFDRAFEAVVTPKHHQPAAKAAREKS